MTQHYFTPSPKSPLRTRTIEARLRGRLLTFQTGSGTFSPKKIDLGTALLIQEAIVKPGWTVLDLGCGYGPVGIAIAKAIPTTRVIMTDVNERAVSLARKNAAMNSVKAEIRQGDMFDAVPEYFDTILFNPPQTAGKKTCELMITQSRQHLKPGGTLQVVARHQKGGRELAKHMNSEFGNVRETAKKSGYRIYVSEL